MSSRLSSQAAPAAAAYSAPRLLPAADDAEYSRQIGAYVDKQLEAALSLRSYSGPIPTPPMKRSATVAKLATPASTPITRPAAAAAAAAAAASSSSSSASLQQKRPSSLAKLPVTKKAKHAPPSESESDSASDGDESNPSDQASENEDEDEPYCRTCKQHIRSDTDIRLSEIDTDFLNEKHDYHCLDCHKGFDLDDFEPDEFAALNSPEEVLESLIVELDPKPKAGTEGEAVIQCIAVCPDAYDSEHCPHQLELGVEVKMLVRFRYHGPARSPSEPPRLTIIRQTLVGPNEKVSNGMDELGTFDRNKGAQGKKNKAGGVAAATTKPKYARITPSIKAAPKSARITPGIRLEPSEAAASNKKKPPPAKASSSSAAAAAAASNSSPDEELFEVSSILASRIRAGKLEYHVLWKGYSLEEATWEPKASLVNAQQALSEFHSKQTAHAHAKKKA